MAETTPGAEAASPAAPSPRLNPFAFPSDTDLRFVLLVAAVTGVSLFMYYSLSFRLSADYGQAARECLEATQTVDDLEASVQAFARCLAPTDRQTATWPMAGAVAVLGIAGLIYWLMPAWKIQRDRLEPFTEDDDPVLVATVAELAREAGLKRPPAILTNADMTPGGLAFGRWGRYSLVLNAGLIVQSTLDPDAFRAVVRHELAHLRNGDVDKTYFSLAAGGAILVGAFLPYLIVVGVSGIRAANPLTVLDQGWRIVVALLLSYGPIAGILRARELDADVRASQWEGPNGGLRRVLTELEPVVGGAVGTLSMHPSPELRARAVDDPRLLMGMSFWDALAIGVAATVAYPELTLILGLFTAGEQLRTFSAMVSGLLFGALAAAVVGTGIWRAAFAGLSEGKLRVDLNRLALGLGLGMLMGPMLSNTAANQGSVDLRDGPTLFLTAGWAVVVIVSLRVFLAWVALGARAWIAAAATHSSPRVAYLVGMALTALLLGAWIGLLLSARGLAVGLFGGDSFTLLPVIGPFMALGAALMILPHPAAFAALFVLWAFPLSSAWWARKEPAAPGPRWYWLDPSDEPLEHHRGEIQAAKAMLTGMAGGIVFCLLLTAARLYLRSTGVAATVEDQEAYQFFLWGEAAAAVMAQLVLAGVAAWRVSRLAVVHGLCALSVAGLIMTAGMLAIHAALGPPIHPDIVPLGLGIIVNLAALLAAPVMWLTGMCSRLTARMLRPSLAAIDPQPAEARSA